MAILEARPITGTVKCAACHKKITTPFALYHGKKAYCGAKCARKG